MNHLQLHTNLPVITSADTDLPIGSGRPRKGETWKAIQKLNNGKAARPDKIPAEVLKADENTPVEMYQLFGKIWEEDNISQEWKEGTIIKLPKKGDLSNFSNYGGITLLSVPGKVLE